MSPKQFVHFLSTRLKAALSPRSFGSVETFCLFIGYPRSGHTLVSALLTAHPDAVVANELDVLRWLKKEGRLVRYSRPQVFGMILDHDRRFHEEGSEWSDYEYAVEGQFQGDVRTLRVIGDKHGPVTARALHEDPALLERLRELAGVPVRALHVTRHPLDNISTMARRNPGSSLREQMERYGDMCGWVRGALERFDPGHVHTVRHEAFLDAPVESLRSIVEFLGLDAPGTYLEDCAAIVRPTPHRSREKAEWTPELRDEVGDLIGRFEFLDPYASGKG